MKKLILLIILVIATAIPATAYYIGTTVEETFRAEHEEMDHQATLSGFEIELVKYQRKLLNATATTRIRIPHPEDKDEFVLELHHSIEHLPQLADQVIATIETKLVPSEMNKEILVPLFKGQTPLSVNTRIFFDGHQEGSFHSPAASGQLAGDEQINIEWMGLNGSAWQSASRDQVKLEMRIPKVSFSTKESSASGEVTISNTYYEADMHKGASGMWQGDAKITIASIEADVTDKSRKHTSIHIDSININAEQSETNGLLQTSSVMKSKRISVDDFTLSNATYDFAVENIDSRAIMALQVEIQKMAKEKTGTADPMVPLRAHLPALFNAQPIIKINDLSVDSPMGRFSLKLESQINGQWNDMILENPAMLTTMISANIDASVPRTVVVSALEDQVRNTIIDQAIANDVEMSEEKLESVVKQSVSQQLEGLISQGYIKANALQLESQLQYNAGQLTINGMDASPLFGAMMQ